MKVIKVIILLISVINTTTNYNAENKVNNNDDNILKEMWNKRNVNENINLKEIICAMISNQNEETTQRNKRKKNNKTIHAKNGNRTKTKEKSNYKLMTLNKGNSYFLTKKETLNHFIEKEKPDILAIMESNLVSDDTDAKKAFEDYHIENQIMDHASMSRVCLMIKKGIKYQRMKELENPMVSMCWIKVKTSKNKGFLLAGVYREWKSPNDQILNTTRSIDDQMARLKRIMESIDTARTKYDEIVYMGDINIDVNADNDPLADPDNRRLYEIQEEHDMANDMVRVNNLPTHHFPGRGSMLIDHIVMTHSNKWDGIENIRNLTSHHDAVACNYHVKDISRKPQYRRFRSYKYMNLEALMNLIESSEKLNETFFSKTDPDDIAETLIEEYNRILNTIAPSKRVPIRKEETKYLDENIKEMKSYAESKLTEAINKNNNENWRIARYARKQYEKALDKAKTVYYKKILNTDYNL